MCTQHKVFAPHPYSILILEVFPLDQIADMLVSAPAFTLSYSAVKLFSKYSNLYDYGT